MEKTVHLIRWCSIYANAGLPNAFGGYDETPEIFSKNMLQSTERCSYRLPRGGTLSCAPFSAMARGAVRSRKAMDEAASCCGPR